MGSPPALFYKNNVDRLPIVLSVVLGQLLFSYLVSSLVT